MLSIFSLHKLDCMIKRKHLNGLVFELGIDLGDVLVEPSLKQRQSIGEDFFSCGKVMRLLKLLLRVTLICLSRTLSDDWSLLIRNGAKLDRLRGVKALVWIEPYTKFSMNFICSSMKATDKS